MSTDVLTETKRCTGCRKVQPIAEFYRTSNGYLVSWCKACRRDKQKEQRAILRAAGVKRERKKPAPATNFTYCECGERVYRAGLCTDCWTERYGYVPTPAEIEAMKLQIRRENGHDPKQPRLFQAARG